MLPVMFISSLYGCHYLLVTCYLSRRVHVCQLDVMALYAFVLRISEGRTVAETCTRLHVYARFILLYKLCVFGGGGGGGGVCVCVWVTTV
jgi:hypothetical protein